MNSRKGFASIIPLIIGLLIVLGSVYVALKLRPTHTPTSSHVLTLEDLKSAVLPGAAMDGKDVQLVQGKFEERYFEGRGSGTPNSTRSIQILEQSIAFGDLDGDGIGDAAAVFAENFGGSGSFEDIKVFVNGTQGAKYLGNAGIGDRAKINFIKIQDGTVTINFLTQGPGDGMCCPTLPETASYRITEGKLVKVSDMKTYQNTALGITFEYSARFSEARRGPTWARIPADTLAAFDSYKDKRIPDNTTYPDEEILVRRYAISSSGSFEGILLENTVKDASGLHPKSLAEFTKKAIGGKEFYSIMTSRFEGTLSFAYYLITPSYVYRFDSVDQGTDWTNQNLDTENDPTHIALKELLGTLAISR